MSNLRIWDSFGKTDPKYTKNNTQGGRSSTSITPVYMVKKATEALGPIGVGWGYKVIEERFDNTAPIVLKKGSSSELPVYMTDNGAIVYEKLTRYYWSFGLRVVIKHSVSMGILDTHT